MRTAKRQISVILYTIRFSPLSYAEKLKRLREIGYRSIQGGMRGDMTLSEHKALLDGLGMEMSCFAGGLEDIEARPDAFIEACKAFDCDEVMIGTMPTEYRADCEGYLRGAERISNAARALKAAGIYLGYHNHAQEFRKFPNGRIGMDVLFDAFDPDAVHFLPDTHWVHAGGGDILNWLEKLKNRIAYLHVKDYRIAPANYLTGIGEADKQFAQIGGGNLPWREIVDAALRVGVRSFIVEQDFTYDEDPFDCVAESYATLKGLGLE